MDNPIVVGVVTAYGAAKRAGYTGTYAEFCEEMANLGIEVGHLENMTVNVNILEPSATASATYAEGVLTLNLPKGDTGATGQTAYQYAVDGGYTGTEAEFTQLCADLGIEVGHLENMTVVVNQVASSVAPSGTYVDGTLTINVPAATDAQVSSAADTWLAANVDPATGYVLDRTLTLENAAAPADLVGDLKESLTYNTVNGDIVWFNDAQEAPVANISVDNEATILNRLGTNLAYIRNLFSGTTYGLTSAENADGSYHITGQVTVSTWIYYGRYLNLDALGLKPGMALTISLNKDYSTPNFAIWFVDSNNNRIGSLETFGSTDYIASGVIPEGTTKLRFLLYPQGGNSAPTIGTVFDEILFPQLEIGNSATPFQRGELKQYSISNGTPTEQVTTLKGKNSFWANTGNVNVKYLLDVKTYIDNKIAELQATMLENIGG